MRRSFLAILLLGISAPALLAQPATPAPSAAPDPARLAAAERLVDLIMSGNLLQRVVGQGNPGGEVVVQTPPEELGLPADPHFAERMRIHARVTNEAMVEVMTALEPDLRRMFASFFARHFTLAEIGELTVFFSTPVGRRYAELSATMMEDPMLLEWVRAMVPRFTDVTARIDERVRAATAHLPPPPEPEPVEEEMTNMSNAL